MKVLEPCEALLSNYEVLEHVQDVKRRYREEITEKGRAVAMKPGNLETVMKELIDYLTSTAAASQTSETSSHLVESLTRFNFEKIEVLMILNHLPKNETELDVLIEELESRLAEKEIAEILEAIHTVLETKTNFEVSGP
ncbi:hypothetical protein TWF694_011897 [Orbilia ellipsospora]|uniref:DNA-directed RNA polymerase III subunit RPC9 n=1 Tax=Orbilia ellipsospora TaxID=2528407 RepID=A0AAV9X6L1_9PEZI